MKSTAFPSSPCYLLGHLSYLSITSACSLRITPDLPSLHWPLPPVTGGNGTGQKSHLTLLDPAHIHTPLAGLQAPCRQHPSWSAPQHQVYYARGPQPTHRTQLTDRTAPQASPQRHALAHDHPSPSCFSGHQGHLLLHLTLQLLPFGAPSLKFYHVSKEHTLLCLAELYPRNHKHTSPH